MTDRDSKPLDRAKLALIVADAERREIPLDERLQKIVCLLHKWRRQISDPSADGVNVEFHCRGRRVTASVQALDDGLK